jgi:hypothetical protein
VSLERTYLLGVDFGWYSAAYLAGAAVVLLIALIGVIGRLPLSAGLLAALVIVVGCAHMASVHHGCWFGQGVGECYANPVAQPQAYSGFRHDHAVEIAETVRRNVPGGEVTVGIEAMSGWTWFRRAAHAALLLVVIGVALRLLHPATALVVAGTGWLVVSAMIIDSGSNEYQGLGTVLAVAVSSLIWAVFGAGYLVARRFPERIGDL